MHESYAGNSIDTTMMGNNVKIKNGSYSEELRYRELLQRYYTSNKDINFEILYTIQLANKFTACIEQHAKELLVFDTRVSRLLTHATMLASYARHDLYVLARIPTRVILPMHASLLTSCFMQ